MGKKRKASRQPVAPSGPRDVDPADARLQVNSYEDIADSEEEYFINKDKILLDDGPISKRRKAEKEDAMFESSDEEVLGDDDDDDDDSEDDDDMDRRQQDSDDGGRPRADGSEADQDDRGYWGSSKKEYYEADTLETEADALAEEAEAKRLQQKKLARMSEADFMFDADEWNAQGGDADEEGQAGGDGVLTEVLKDVDITSDMGPDEIYKALQARYPEFDFLVDEFQQLQPRLSEYRQAAEGKPSKCLEVVQYWTLGCYIAALASYFAILTSPSRDGHGQPKALDPAALRDHEIMATLVNCRQAWSKVQKFTGSAKAAGLSSDAQPRRAAAGELPPTQAGDSRDASKARLDDNAGPGSKKKRLDKQKLAKAKKLEDSLADLSELLPPKSQQKRKPRRQAASSNAADAAGAGEDDNSDFGDEDALDVRAAEDKAARKKSLRFYTSQIVQKAGKRAGAGREAGGDMDIPHRERLRDRQARLNAEAERRGQKSSKYGEELDDDDDDDDDQAVLANEVRDDEDEYYDMVAHGARQKKADKAARHEALKAASKNDQVVEREEVGEDGKRQVTYHILKNKGLTPKRKKEAKNSRVKKRKKFEEKQKKLKSIRAVYGGGESRGGYQGELSGIKTGLVKSVKLS
ncbi:hypothetical protein MAPG_00584 [Magnaporthiopsis poae ATCC 64411]|uniref:Sas10 C-terminal domain-containing protein n=1 Tax=Magnaporthiopsis poae (strain ATCC 64411 / 73-15) TaxID=644358 RepID=A0A0C4DLE3_MAGP6|nr:hypothetical protein MAPG_00584 [Magnaporthiopsis poae ATCC 64411]